MADADPETEARLIALETAVTSIGEFIQAKFDFSERKFYNARLAENTPPPEE